MARRWLTWLLWAIAVLLILATLIPILDSNHWWVRNLTFPQAQITACLAIVLVVAIVALKLSRTAVRLLIVALIASLIYQLFYLLPYTPIAGTTVRSVAACPADERFTLIEANVRASNNNHDAVLALVRKDDPDLFFAVETDDVWRRALAPLRADYPYVIAARRNDYWGMMLFSKLPLADAQVQHLVDGYVPSIRAEVALPSGGRFVFHGLHPRPPMMHGSAKGDAEMAKAGRIIARERQPALLTGDLNDVPWSSTTQLFQQLSAMSDPRVGRGFYASFDADSRILRWPLDHIFVTPDFRVVDYERLADIGSDHFPMLATLCFDPADTNDNKPRRSDSAWRRARQIIRTGNRAKGK